MDYIQELIKNIMNSASYMPKRYLENKLHEEVGEYIEAKNLEELADIMEVIYGLADSLGYSEQDLNECRNRKYEERGGFKKRIILRKVW